MKAIDSLLSALVSLLFREAKTNAEVSYNPKMGRIELTHSWYDGMRIVYKRTAEIGLFTVARDVHRVSNKDLLLIRQWATRKYHDQDYSDGCPRVFLRKLFQHVDSAERDSSGMTL